MGRVDRRQYFTEQWYFKEWFNNLPPESRVIGIIKGIINHKYDVDKKKIELRKLSAEADLAEQQALKQKLENIETMRRLQLSSVDAYAEPLATAAKNLAVQPSFATIIDITKILKSQQEDQPPQ